MTSDLDDIVRALCRVTNTKITSDNEVNGVDPGRLLGHLDAEQAKHFADLAYEVTHDRLTIADDGTGTLRIVAATQK